MRRAKRRTRSIELAWVLVLSSCARPHDRSLADTDPLEPAVGVLTSQVFELASRFEMPDLERLAHEVALADPPTATTPEPLTDVEIAELLTAAEQHLRTLDIKAKARHGARGPLPDAAGLRHVYAEQRALVIEGRYDQVRQWAALAKFGRAEPGPLVDDGRGRSPLSRYDLVVTRDPRKPTAYLHVVVPELGLAGLDEHGRHEAWIDGERWINLADVIEPGRDYLPFKTNGNESLHRQWAKAEFVDALVEIAGEYRQRTGLPLGIGDLSHVTGGKIEDHWTHQEGVDVDLYLLDPAVTDDDGRPRVWWNHVKRGVSSWTSKAKGKGEREPALDPSDPNSHTPTSRRLEILAQIVFVIDEIAYFVHNDSSTLAAFDEQVEERRPGRRYLHANNRGYWPTHADHVHLRWVEGKLPVGVTPRP